MDENIANVMLTSAERFHDPETSNLTKLETSNSYSYSYEYEYYPSKGLVPRTAK